MSVCRWGLRRFVPLNVLCTVARFSMIYAVLFNQIHVYEIKHVRLISKLQIDERCCLLLFVVVCGTLLKKDQAHVSTILVLSSNE